MPATDTTSTTHQRILDAASRVFAREGLTGATTRAIADEAQVNEVTVFRHFKSKDKLLAAVIGSNFTPQPTAGASIIPAPTDNLRNDLVALARHYERLLTDNLPLVRTMLGEVQHRRHRDHEREVFHGIFAPIKGALLARIQAGQSDGDLSREIRGDLLADLFGGMIFTGVIRRSSSHLKLEYAAPVHLDAAVELVLRGARTKR